MSWEEYVKRIEQEIDYIEDGCYSQEESLLESGEYLERNTFYTKDANGNVYESKILDKPKGPLYEDAISLGSSAAKVYLFLWNAACMDNCRKIYNSNNWSVKGIAGELGMCNKTAGRAIDKLLDSGLIQIIGEEGNSFGSHNTIWGVTHSDWIENVRYAIRMMGDKPSTRLKKMRAKAKKIDTSGVTEKYKSLDWLDYDPAKQTIMDPVKPRTAKQKKSIEKFLRHKIDKDTPVTPVQPWVKEHIKQLQLEGLL